VSNIARNLVYKLPREIKLTPSARRLLEYLADRAGDDDAQSNDGQFYAYPSEKSIFEDLKIGNGTLYRACGQLEYEWPHLITRRNARKGSSVLFDLHIKPSDLTPDAIQTRKQSAAARLSASPGGPGARKRNTSATGAELPEISQNCDTPPEDYLPEREVITSHSGRYSGAKLPPILETITSHSEEITSHFGNPSLLNNKELNTERGERKTAAPPPSEKRKGKNPKPPDKDPATKILELHAEMWTAAAHGMLDGLPLPEKFDKDASPEAYRLLSQALTHVGGGIRFKTFKQRPREASFARKEFLEYLRNNDPAYEQAIADTITVSLGVSPSGRPNAKSSRSP
jgi:hypothetical protein